MPTTEIRPRERDAIIQSLRAGVVPRSGLHLIQVGRAREVEALLKDIECVADGGSTIRFVIGEYGAGKTFFLNLVRTIALEKRLVTTNADLSPERRLYATGGQARLLYAELMRNIATRSKPDGGALQNIVERFISEVLREARSTGENPEAIIYGRLAKLSEMLGGYDFAKVVASYWQGHDTGNEQLKADAIRWLRAEFTTKTEARAALGVRTIINDATVYDHLKLMAYFVRMAGFSGLLICMDELVNIYKLANSQARNSNYEQILRILNDCLQGSVEGLGIIMGGTPDFLMDTARGVYSYSALQSRLSENAFAVQGLVDFSGPVIRLGNLTPEDFYILTNRIRNVFAGGNPEANLVPDEALEAFRQHCSQRIGDAYFRTPRNTITSFVQLLSVLEQNKSARWQDLIGDVVIEPDTSPNLEPIGENENGSMLHAAHDGSDDLATFQL